MLVASHGSEHLRRRARVGVAHAGTKRLNFHEKWSSHDIVIAHPVRPVREATEIIVQEGGRTAERGTHGTRLALDGAGAPSTAGTLPLPVQRLCRPAAIGPGSPDWMSRSRRRLGITRRDHPFGGRQRA